MSPRASQHRRHRGVTLVEMMVSVGLLSVIVAATLGVLITMNNSAGRIQRVSNTQEAARLALDELAAELRAAGLGASSGVVGIATAASSTRRVPVVFSGPDVTVWEPGRNTWLTSNSIFIVSSDPTSVGVGADGTGMQGVVTNATIGSSLTVACVNGAGAVVACTAGDSLLPATGALPPLIVGDFHNAVYLRPTTYSNSSGTGTLAFTEQSYNAFSPDPKAPFGFSPGSTLARARVTHWYLRQDDANAPPRLFRSRPTLASTQLNCTSTGVVYPFTDANMTSPTGTDSTGVEVGAGPIVSMQIRYVVDDLATDDPRQFHVIPRITSCDRDVMQMLREVRIQFVAIATSADKASGQRRLAVGYRTPAFEGNSPSSTSPSALPDSYPRRSFVTRAVPRALQGIRL